MLLTGVAALAAWLFVPASPVRTEGRIDLRAAALLSGWLVCLLLPVSQGRDWGWASPLTVGLLAASAVLCALWVRTELRSDAPLIDMRMMRLPAVWTTNLVSLLFGVGMYAGYAFLPQFLQTPERAGYGFGASVTMSGLLLLPQSLATFVVGLLSGRLAARYGSKRLLGRRRRPVRGVAARPRARARLDLAGAGRDRARRLGVRPGLRRHVEPRRRGGAALADRGRERDERQHPHRRRRDRRGGPRLVVTAGARADGLPVEAGYTHGFAVLAGCSAVAALVRPARAGAAPVHCSRGRGAPPRAGRGRRGHARQRHGALTWTVKPLRRDAAANRERVLDAAAEVFHEHGLGAGLEDVARRAGSVWRPSTGASHPRRAARDAAVGPAAGLPRRGGAGARTADGTGLATFVRTVAEVQATPRGCALRLWSSPAVEQLRASLHERMADLITDAQAHGTCREGVTVGDLVGVLVALRGVRETPTSTGGLDWRRHLELCLAGLRP
jgi:hypothetical protein